PAGSPPEPDPDRPSYLPGSSAAPERTEPQRNRAHSAPSGREAAEWSIQLADCRQGGTSQGGGDRLEVEILEQPPDSRRCAPEPTVVANPGLQIHVETRLFRIELPRMDIEGARDAATLRRLQSGVHQSIRKEPEIGAAAGRK